MTKYNVGVLIESFSKETINHKPYNAHVKPAPAANLELTEVPIRDLPLHNRDLDYVFPVEVWDYKKAVVASDAIIIGTPDNNRSVVGAFKSTQDWASRPWDDNSLAGKPSAVIGHCWSRAWLPRSCISQRCTRQARRSSKASVRPSKKPEPGATSPTFRPRSHDRGARIDQHSNHRSIRHQNRSLEICRRHLPTGARGRDRPGAHRENDRHDPRNSDRPPAAATCR